MVRHAGDLGDSSRILRKWSPKSLLASYSVQQQFSVRTSLYESLGLAVAITSISFLFVCVKEKFLIGKKWALGNT